MYTYRYILFCQDAVRGAPPDPRLELGDGELPGPLYTYYLLYYIIVL